MRFYINFLSLCLHHKLILFKYGFYTILYTSFTGIIYNAPLYVLDPVARSLLSIFWTAVQASYAAAAAVSIDLAIAPPCTIFTIILLLVCVHAAAALQTVAHIPILQHFSCKKYAQRLTILF